MNEKETVKEEEKEFEEAWSHENPASQDERWLTLKGIARKWWLASASRKDKEIKELKNQLNELMEEIEKHKKENFRLISHPDLCQIDIELYKIFEKVLIHER